MSLAGDAIRLRVRARRQLDARLLARHQLTPDARARQAGDWVRAIRYALGMSAEDLADRMNVSRVAVSKLEASERAGTIGMDTLTRAAGALRCDVVYALVPRVPLPEQVDRQAHLVATNELRPVLVTMQLEAQGVDTDEIRELVADRAAELAQSRGLWHTAS